MANKLIEGELGTEMMCKQCLQYKVLSDVYRYKHSKGFMGFLGRCKCCILLGRKTEKELRMSRSRDRNRYQNNQDRREYVYARSKEHRINRGYGKIHLMCQRAIRKNGIRPSTCPICGDSGRIEAHHFDYNLPLQIVFCCKVCHSKLDMNKIDRRDCEIVDVSKPF